MKEITIIDRISKLIDEINYQTVYIEIRTVKNKYTIEKEKVIKVAGFGRK